MVTRAEGQISASQIITLFLGFDGGARGKEDPVSDGSLVPAGGPRTLSFPSRSLVTGLKAF